MSDPKSKTCEANRIAGISTDYIDAEAATQFRLMWDSYTPNYQGMFDEIEAHRRKMKSRLASSPQQQICKELT